ncbi:PREDICTED: nuclear cap-binding protein subunit 1-like [Drosophila arizonae]|uniref:Nuclear cap-binding protein subunit 1 n=1 Tax=Drosophila arizonae TaxID=7263 RepID=A0ABM1NYB8_DROAR|nr:PREDICTED: nuclear cap-binding protein subunit 1-like [Drosophila arizonae]
MNSRRRCREVSPEEPLPAEAGGRPTKCARRPDHKEVMATIENLMIKLSDYNSATVQGRIEDLSYYVTDTLHIYKWDILRTLVDCVEKYPMQCGAYATFVGLVNVQDYEFGSECLKCVTQQLVKALYEGEWLKAQSLVLLLADLVNTNVLTVGSMLQLLNSLVDVCEEEDASHRRRDFYAHLVLSSLPLVGRELYEKKETVLQTLLKRLQVYIKRERSPGEGTRLLRIFNNCDVPQLDYLELLWLQIKRLMHAKWIEKELLRPYAAFDENLSTALQHHLPPFQPPCHEDDSADYPHPWLVFRLFEANDFPPHMRMPDELDIGRHIIEAHIMETVRLHHLERKICAERLMAYCVAKPTRPMEHCIIEVLLGQMLQLPSSPLLTINYGALIIELCKLVPDKFPRIVAQAADMLYTQLEYMNPSSFDRFVNWFSHHLSNFRYQWNWQDWENSITLPEFHPTRQFVRELLKKCMRLSYHQHIVQLVPASYAPLLPASPDPNFKYIDGLLPGAKLAKHVLDAIRSKCAPELLGGLLEATTELDEGLKINVLMQSLLHLGCKSFTHIFSLLSKFQPVLKMLAHNDANQLAMLRALFEVWSNNEHVKLVVADKLLKMHIVSNHAVVAWVFNPSLKSELVKMYLWELLNLTVRYTKYHMRITEDNQSTDLNCLLLNIAQTCVKVLMDHRKSEQSSEVDYWFQWIQGRLLQLLFNYIDDVRKISSKLREIAFEAEEAKSLSNMINDYLNYIT